MNETCGDFTRKLAGGHLVSLIHEYHQHNLDWESIKFGILQIHSISRKGHKIINHERLLQIRK